MEDGAMPHSLAELLFAVALPARPRTAPVAEISACLAGTTSAGRKFVFSDYSGSIRREGAATAPVTANWPSAGRRSRRVPLTRRASRQSRPNAVRLQIRCRAAALIVEPRLRPDRLVIIREEQRLHSFRHASSMRTRQRGQPRSSEHMVAPLQEHALHDDFNLETTTPSLTANSPTSCPPAVTSRLGVLPKSVPCVLRAGAPPPQGENRPILAVYPGFLARARGRGATFWRPGPASPHAWRTLGLDADGGGGWCAGRAARPDRGETDLILRGWFRSAAGPDLRRRNTFS
ncbi:hypothetical protein PCL_07853 [Purpureocillium lilacinum]|uniref:Uncharacterized protein n=1 Tax=Purpureocillium lilacinum TaxID=33203 RepID=A0A2U3EJ59_PURLI|nr:hypothetical protein PCL_07853 [Purpureocillium lilacinum]